MTSPETTQISKRVIILGYYGAGNTGDEAILTGMLQALRDKGITDITVLSRNPELTARLHRVKAVYTGRRAKGIATVYRTIRDSDLFILGGGGLLHDHTARVVPYWLSRVFLARVARTPIYFYAQGVGPIYRSFSRFLISRLVNKVDYITVRDAPSFKLLRELGVTQPPIEVTADPAILLTSQADGGKLLRKEQLILDHDRINIAISLRPWKDEAYQKNLIAALQNITSQHRVHYTLIPFQYGQDEEISLKFQLALPNANLLKQEYSPIELIAILEQFDGIIAMRLHALILGAISNRPLFALSYDEKVANFMDRIDLNEYNYSLETIAQQSTELPNKLDNSLNHWLNHLSETSNKLRPQVTEQQLQAKRNAEIASQLLIRIQNT